MSGLELLGAVSAAATLADLSRKISKKVLSLQGATGDATVVDIHSRVAALTGAIEEIMFFLQKTYTETKNDTPTHFKSSEDRLWGKLTDVLNSCRENLKILDSWLERIHSRSDSMFDRARESILLSAITPDVRRISDNVQAYFEAIRTFKSLLQEVSQQKQQALQRALNRDFRDFKEIHRQKMDRILGELQEIKETLPQQLPRSTPTDLVPNDDALDSSNEQTVRLSANLQDFLAAAEDMKTSFTKSETSSLGSDLTSASAHALVESSSSSNVVEPPSKPLLQLPPDVPPQPDFPAITHIEPLKELARRLSERAETEKGQDQFHRAEIYQKEAIACHEELHEAYGIFFESFSQMHIDLAEMKKKQQLFDEAMAIVTRVQNQGFKYEHSLKCRTVELDMDTNFSEKARAYHVMAEISFDKAKDNAAHLEDAERNAKQAFLLRRVKLGREHPEVKQTARLLINIYRKTPNKYAYADVYRDLYLSGSEPHQATTGGLDGLSLTRSHSRSIPCSDLIEAVKSHRPHDLDDLIGQIIDARESGIDLNQTKDNKSAMMHAIDCRIENCERCVAVIRTLRQNEADLDAPFEYAIEHAQIPKCLLLVELGANVNKPDSDLYTPLMKAVLSMDIELVRLLIEKGADLNLVGDKGYTALHLVVQNHPHKDPQVLDLLLKQKDLLLVDAQDTLGMTALHYCVRQGKSRFTKRLLRAEADIEMRDLTQARRTPLYIAVREGKLGIAKDLLLAGAKINFQALPHPSGDMRNLLRHKDYRSQVTND